ncbi:hypothetical protein CCMA1212_004604, partial [Trichoderma ghanense]
TFFFLKPVGISFSKYARLSAAAAIRPEYENPCIIWQHPTSAIALLAIILSIVILLAATTSDACLSTDSYGPDTRILYSVRQEWDRRRGSSLERHRQLEDHMDPFEEAPSWGFEPSTSREQVFTKDKPSPLRIIKRRHSNDRYDGRTCKGNYTAVDPHGSPSESSFIRSEFLPTLRLPRRRPKSVSERKNGYENETATGLGRPSQKLSFGNCSMSREDDNDVPGQDHNLRNASFFRHSASRFKRFRQKRHSVTSSLDTGEGDRNFSACTLPSERNIWLDLSSRASSRCTNYELEAACYSTNLPIPSKLTRPKESSFVLSPHIRVVSETVGTSFGQQHLWAAVEVTGRLSRAGDGPELDPEMMAGLDKDTASKFGYLYDVIVDILPTPQSSILQIIRQQDIQATMFVGSSVLLLVHVLCRSGVASCPPRQYKHPRQRSEELMEDLEMQLGNSFMPFVNIHVTYSHSAFPSHLASGEGVEMSSLYTKLRTSAEATVKLHNALSPWSPHPVMAKGRLLPLIRRHWGAQRASEVMRQMLEQRSVSSPAHTSERSERFFQSMAQRLLDPTYSPAMSPRQTSGQGTQQMTTDADITAESSPVMRLSCDSGISMRGVSRGEMSVTANRDQPCEDAKGQEDTIRRKRPMTPNVLRNSTPSFASNSVGDRNKDGADDTSDRKRDKKKQGATGDDGGKRKSGLWTWASWF